MKHAILILAHKDPAQLYKLIDYFESDCEVFIHVDKKSAFTEKDLKELRELPNVSGVYRKYSVHWAGFKLLECILYFLKKALSTSQADYFHLISGQDYPLKPFQDFKDFFSKNEPKEYLGFLPLPNNYWESWTYQRFQYFEPNDWLDARSPKGRKIVQKLLGWQKKWNIKRRIPDHFDHLYGGATWFSITREAAVLLLEYTRKKPAFYNRLKYTFVPEETYIPTVLANLLPSPRVCNYNYRYVKWVVEEDNSCVSANLTEKNLFSLTRTDALFARKFDLKSCEKIIHWIDTYLLKKEKLRVTETGAWLNPTFSLHTFDRSLSEALVRLCKLMRTETVVDLGCGTGMYVGVLRKAGLGITGYDGNPNVKEQFARLFPDSFPCETVDLTEDLTNEDPFDMVICLDVCPYIPACYEDRVVSNLASNASRYIVLSWASPESKKEGYVNTRSAEYVLQKFSEYGFTEHVPSRNFLREQAGLSQFKQSLFVFQKVKAVD